MTQIDGIDYLTGKEYPISDLRIVSKDGDTPDSVTFPEVSEDFAKFAALFTKKYGVGKVGTPPVVLSEDSLSTVRQYYDSGMTIKP